MAAAFVTIICIAMIVVGGMTLSQGILTSADSAALSVETISVREGDIMRTDIDVLRASQLSWGGDDLRITVKNSGQTKLASYDKWDLIATYETSDGTMHSTWLPYTASMLTNNEWTKARIGLNGPFEYFEPGILNPGEEMVILAKLSPLPGNTTTGDISLTTPNGVYDSIPLITPGYLRLTPQSEKITLGGTKYYELVEAAPADGPALTVGTEYSSGEAGRKLLHDITNTSRSASFIYPLLGISQIPSDNWTVNYRCMVSGGATFPQSDDDTSFNIAIIIRQADGNIRDTITVNAASAFVPMSAAGSWTTITGSYQFPGYAVIDSSDYLEIDFYTQTNLGPDSGTGNMQVSIDNNSLSLDDQTRIEAL
jgi:hypothetical protein